MANEKIPEVKGPQPPDLRGQAKARIIAAPNSAPVLLFTVDCLSVALPANPII